MLEKIVYEQFEAVRTLGACNMMDRRCVRGYAEDLDLSALVDEIDSMNYAEILNTYSEAKEKGWV